MKQLIRRIGMLLAIVVANLTVYAYDFEVNGIYYNILSDNTCEVTYGETQDSGVYSGIVTIPNQVANDNHVYSVTSIGHSAFYKCRSLTSVDIPNSITSINNFAFQYCTSLSEVTIPQSVTYIGEAAFSGCSSLSSIIIPESVTAINRFVFSNCTSLESVIIGSSVNSIYQYAFNNCSSLTSVTIPDSVVEIEDWAFFNCSSLVSVAIGKSVSSVGGLTFLSCTSLFEISVDEDNQYYCSVDGVLFNKDRSKLIAFPNAKCEDYIIPNTVTEIGRCAFDSCNSIKSVIIPNSVTVIGELAFFGYEGSSLDSVTISDSVREIGNYAFAQCIELTKFYYNCVDPIEIEDDTIFKESLEKASLYVPKDAVEKCQITSPWKYFKNILAYDFSGVETVSGDAQKIVTGSYDISGSSVNEDYKGIVIVQYSDGSIQKILQK